MLQPGGRGPGDLPMRRRELAARLTPRLGTPGSRTMLVGDAGIGKTYLLEAMLDSSSSGLRRYRTELRPEVSSEPYFAIRDLLRSVQPTAQRRSNPQVGAPIDVPVHELGATVRSSLRQAASAGVLVVIDGWQWLDRESRSLLEHALEDPLLRQSVVLLATRRLDDSAEDLAVQPLFGTSDVFAIDPLPPRAIIDLVRAAARSHLPDAVASDLARASRGNPLLALELAASTGGHNPAGSTAPVVSDAVRQRLQALDPDVRRLIATLGVMGPARPSEVAMVCERVSTATGPAIDLGLVRRVGDELVADPLLARAASEQLPVDEMQRIHVKLAASPLPRPVQLEHRDDAAPAGLDEALAGDLLVEATRARRADENETALRLVRRSLNRTDPSTDRYRERTIAAAELAATLADSSLVLHLLQEVDFERLDLALLDRAVPLLALALTRRGGAAAVRLRLLELHSAQRSSTGKDVIFVQLVTVGWEGDAVDQRREIARAADRVERAKVPLTWRIAQQWVAVMLLDQGFGLSEGALASIRSAEPVPVQLEESAAVLAASWAYQSDDLRRSRAELTAMIRAASVHRETFVMVQSLAHLAKVELLMGRTDRALPRLLEAESRAARLNDIPPSLLAAQGLASVYQHHAAMLQILADDPHGLRSLGRGEMIAHALLGLDAAYSTEWDRALEELLHARSTAERIDIHEPGRRFWIDIELARAFIAKGDLKGAEQVAAHLDSIAAAPVRSHVRGQALRIRGLIAADRGADSDAVALLRSAVVDLMRGGFRLELVRARAEYALALHASGADATASRELATARLEAAHADDPRLHLLLKSASDRVDASSVRAALSAAELRVVLLAAGGDTNRRIAEELFLSRRTVETHLANAYRKLGVRTRTQMVVAIQGAVGGMT